MGGRVWAELTSAEVADLVRARTIAVLPFAAMEQHGPHLPLATDTVLAEGLLAMAMTQCPADLSVAVLPVQSIGVSGEHLAFPGTLSLPAPLALGAWTALIDGVVGAGLNKLVLVSSHGGNSEVLGLLARDARIRHRVACVVTSWRRFGLPPGLYTEDEATYGIHGGDVETSLMLHFRPDLVRREAAVDFGSAERQFARDFTHLRTTGRHALAWMTQDLNASGAIGNAAAASPEKGRATAQHQVAGFIELLRDVDAFALDRLG